MGAPPYRRRLVLLLVLALLGEGEPDDRPGEQSPGTFHSALAAALVLPESPSQSTRRDACGAARGAS